MISALLRDSEFEPTAPSAKPCRGALKPPVTFPNLVPLSPVVIRTRMDHPGGCWAKPKLSPALISFPANARPASWSLASLRLGLTVAQE